eukprot:TRINITY_DN5482_c0_g1_i1.p1 TRINITY_DN5482_c0_g1~~TRINITY_DN5482_c0_g1_i1.p1  ORF type:complete len:556 (+),score=47.55 TRINITY_DN5482_c0_g1_i1:83-1750(+)
MFFFFGKSTRGLRMLRASATKRCPKKSSAPFRVLRAPIILTCISCVSGYTTPPPPIDPETEFGVNCTVMEPFIRQVSMLAGTLGRAGVRGENSPGTLAQMSRPHAIVLDSSTQQLYISDSGNHAVRKLVISTGYMFTVAGVVGHPGIAGDGGVATSAFLREPHGLAVDSGARLLFIADKENHAVRFVDLATSRIRTLAGVLGKPGFPSIDGPSKSGRFRSPTGLALDVVERLLYVADQGNKAVRVVNLVVGTLSTLLSAASGVLGSPTGLALDPVLRRIFVADKGRHVVWSVDATSDRGGVDVSVVAGIPDDPAMVGTPIFDTPEGHAQRYDGPATILRLRAPHDVSFDPEWQRLYMTDEAAPTVRRLDFDSGNLTRVLAMAGSYGQYYGPYAIGPIGIHVNRLTLTGIRVHYIHQTVRGFHIFGKWFYFNSSMLPFEPGVHVAFQFRNGLMIWRGYIVIYPNIQDIGPENKQRNCWACSAQAARHPPIPEALEGQWEIGDIVHIPSLHPETTQRVYTAESKNNVVRVADIADPTSVVCPHAPFQPPPLMFEEFA